MKKNKIIWAGIVACGMSGCQSSQNLTTEMLGGSDGREWQVVAMEGTSVSPSSETPFLGFDTKGKLWGFTGCNRLTGQYELKRGGVIDMSKVGSTMMLCPEDKYEATFMTALRAVRKAGIQAKKSLTLMDEQGKTVIELILKENLTAENLNGKWTLVSGKDIKLPENQDEVPNLNFDIKEKRIYGFTGCNRLFGPLDVKALLDGKVNFEKMGMTRMLCQDNGVERTFMKNFNAATALAIHDGFLILKNLKNEELLRFKK